MPRYRRRLLSAGRLGLARQARIGRLKRAYVDVGRAIWKSPERQPGSADQVLELPDRDRGQ
jgi:hypothetical protein